MDLWSELEERIKRHGVRVEERLGLLTQLKIDHEMGGMSVAERKELLLQKVRDSAMRVKGVLRA
ncbi:MAG TPA: hypothetical protein VMX56_07385 [Anaerolineales bacterium]|nr:hypothetical protein [Anaerolineales bacterium]